MVGETCLPSNAYYPRTPDYTLCSGVHVCWSAHSDSSFVYGFMSLDYGFGTMTTTTFEVKTKCVNSFVANFDFIKYNVSEEEMKILHSDQSRIKSLCEEQTFVISKYQCFNWKKVIKSCLVMLKILTNECILGTIFINYENKKLLNVQSRLLTIRSFQWQTSVGALT